MYRLKIFRAVPWADAFTVMTGDMCLLKSWAIRNRRVYPNHTIVAQIQRKGEWFDYRLIEDL